MFYYVIESLSERFGGTRDIAPVGDAGALPPAGAAAVPSAPHAPHEVD
jgi:hypothetical protein